MTRVTRKPAIWLGVGLLLLPVFYALARWGLEAASWIAGVGSLVVAATTLLMPASRPRTSDIPRLLPPSTANFVGRSMEMRRLDKISRSRSRGTTSICVITGPAGCGKTTLAIHWSLANLAKFRDGQFYANLHGFDPLAIEVGTQDVLDSFLRALGVDASQMPASREARAAMFRSRTSQRDVVVVLDNVASVDQLRDLLPGSGLVLVTSRARFTGLISGGAERIEVDSMTATDAKLLLLRILERANVKVDLDLNNVARLCGNLPLALCIVAERIANRPSSPMGLLRQNLESNVMEYLSPETAAISLRATLSWSYSMLDSATQRILWILGLWNYESISTQCVATVAGDSRVEANLDRLRDGNLIEEVYADRWRLHDFVRQYAAEQARFSLSDADQTELVKKTLIWYTQTASAAAQRIAPTWRHLAVRFDLSGVAGESLVDRQSALDWFEREIANLASVIDLGMEWGLFEITWQFAGSIWPYLNLCSRWDLWKRTHVSGLEAARRAGDQFGVAWISVALGVCYQRTGDQRLAAECFKTALQIRRSLDDLRGVASTLCNLGELHASSGRFERALEFGMEALTLATRSGDEDALLRALRFLGDTYLDAEDPEEALRICEEALRLARKRGDDWRAAQLLASIGRCQLVLGYPTEAAVYCSQAASLHRSLGNHRLAWAALVDLAMAQWDAGQRLAAHRLWRQALLSLEVLDDAKCREIESAVNNHPIGPFQRIVLGLSSTRRRALKL